MALFQSNEKYWNWRSKSLHFKHTRLPREMSKNLKSISHILYVLNLRDIMTDAKKLFFHVCKIKDHILQTIKSFYFTLYKVFSSGVRKWKKNLSLNKLDSWNNCVVKNTELLLESSKEMVSFKYQNFLNLMFIPFAF